MVKSDRHELCMKTYKHNSTALCWHLWKERNNIIFRNSHKSTYRCMRFIVNDIIFWTRIPNLEEDRLRFSDDENPKDTVDSIGGEHTQQRTKQTERTATKRGQARDLLHSSKNKVDTSCFMLSLIYFAILYYIFKLCYRD